MSKSSKITSMLDEKFKTAKEIIDQPDMWAVVVYSEGRRVYDDVYMSDQPLDTIIKRLRSQAHEKLYQQTSFDKDYIILALDPWEPSDAMAKQGYEFNVNARVYATISRQRKNRRQK